MNIIVKVFFTLVLSLLSEISFSDEAQTNSNGKKRDVLIIQCDSRQEQCKYYFRNMIKYLRTFTLDYKISRKIDRDIKIYMMVDMFKFGQCREFLMQQLKDLASLDVHLEERFINNKIYLLLFNLNHRLLMSCVEDDSEAKNIN